MNRRGVVAPGLFPPRHDRPAPTYPEYEQLCADAAAALCADAGFPDPVKIRAVREIRRGFDWQLAVLGHGHPQTILETHMLLLADARDLQPPLPQWVVGERAERARMDEQLAARRKSFDDQDEQAWQDVLAQCQVEVEVRRNGKVRARHGYLHNLGHAVPAADAESGSASRPRRHAAGRALCETEKRRKPLDLSGGTGGPVTCDSCLKYAPQLRPALRALDTTAD